MAEKKASSKDNSGSKKKGKGGCLVILFVLLLTPLIAVLGLYFFNKDFRLNTNSVMSIVPGPVGEFFDKYPTKAEEREQIRTISEYFLSLTQDRAVDKLLVLKGEDSRAYDEVLQDMLRINPNKTSSILEAVRNATVNKDALINTVEKINEEISQDVKSVADYIASLPTDLGVEEVLVVISDSINGHQDVAQIFDVMDTDRARALLYRLDSANRNKILSYMNSEQALAIKNAQTNLEREFDSLKQLASVYASENVSTLINTIGNTTVYTMDELAIVYSNIGAKKAGEVLSNITDEAFVTELVSKIKSNQILESGKDEYTPDVLKALKIYREFDDNVKELVNVYSKMPNDKIVTIIESMMVNAAASKVYELDNGDLITLADEDLVLELLRSFTDKKKSEILALLDDTLSTELTRQLVLPKN